MQAKTSWRASVGVTPDNLTAVGIRDPAVVQHVAGHAAASGMIWIRGDLTLTERRLRFLGQGSRRSLGAKAMVKLNADLRPGNVVVSLTSNGFLFQDVTLLQGRDQFCFRMSKRDAASLYAAVIEAVSGPGA